MHFGLTGFRPTEIHVHCSGPEKCESILLELRTELLGENIMCTDYISFRRFIKLKIRFMFRKDAVK
jgi:hypothetical protein